MLGPLMIMKKNENNNNNNYVLSSTLLIEELYCIYQYIIKYINISSLIRL